jgi:hypothetical protein
MKNATEMFKEIVTDIVTDKVAFESVMQRPMGQVNRSFESIIGELMLADWNAMAKLPIQQAVLRITGLEEKTRRPHRPH